MALMLFYGEFDEVKRAELMATLTGQLSGEIDDISSRAWGLLALSKTRRYAVAGLDRLAESLLDELSQERLLDNEITPIMRFVNQFPFATPAEIEERVRILKKRNHATAQRIKSVSKEGILIDVFSTSGETWSLALHATQVAFATYALIANGYYEIVGVPAVYRKQIEDAVRQRADLLNQAACVIPLRYVKVYNILTIFVFLLSGGTVGGVVAYLSGQSLESGIWAGLGTAALFSIVSVRRQQFVIVSLQDWIMKQAERLLGG